MFVRISVGPMLISLFFLQWYRSGTVVYYQVNIDKIVSIIIYDYVLLGIISWTGEGLTTVNNNN